MKTNIILIDYENVQKVDLEPLLGFDVLIKIFVGSNQKTITLALTKAAQKLGEKLTWVQIAGNGKNALDFHIAYYIGRLSTQIENPCFHIISKDKGFMPLTDHLKQEGISCELESSVADISLLKPPVQSPKMDRFDIVVKNLSRSISARPKREKTLRNQISATFNKEISEIEITDIIQKLIDAKKITINEKKINYNI